MHSSDLKYLLAYLIPLSCYNAITHDGIRSWLTVLFAFIVIPFIELLKKPNPHNIDIELDSFNRSKHPFFPVVLFINVPIYIFILYTWFQHIPHIDNVSDVAGKIASLGVFMGAMGINVAHELGHKENYLFKIGAKLLLTPSLYNHFTIQHNLGHHLNVGTPIDPATALKDESLYTYWIRCIPSTYMQSWQINQKVLLRTKKGFFTLQNEMLLCTSLTIVFLCGVYYLFDGLILCYFLIASLISILLLETINYIEHYGLYRKLLPSGRFESVELQHSWNSNHVIGRIMLFELSRHADHHYKANKSYQSLLHYDQSPQLPYGYPGSMLIALIPPLWFKIMNPIVDRFNKTLSNS